MSLHFTHIFGPLLVVVAFFFFGRGIINRTRGKRFRPLPAFLLLLVAMAYRFIVPREALVEAYSFVHEENGLFDMFLDRLTLALMDFGIGMCIDAGYLAKNKHNSKLFWVPGVLALILSTVIYLFAALIDRVADGIRHPDKGNQTELLLELGPDDHIREVKHILRKYHATAHCGFKHIDPKIDAQLDGTEKRNLSQYHVIWVDKDYAAPLVKELQNDFENVDQVAPNHRVEQLKPLPAGHTIARDGRFLANDPYLKDQWYAEVLEYNVVHQLLRKHKPKRKAVVAIVDTGVDSDHEDLKGAFKSSKGHKDEHSHGTHCAGLAGAVTNNKKGVASFNWEGTFITITGYPALNKNGWGSDRSVAQAVIDAANGGADVISMSLGGPGRPPKAQKQAIQYALKKGAIVVVAAGNSNRDARHFTPASMPGVIVVSAVGPSLHKASFSNTNTNLKMPIASPGVDIMSSIPDSKYQRYSGTSMATPIVAGLLGVMRAYKPKLSPEQAHALLHDTGKQVRDSRKIGRVIQPSSVLEKVIGAKAPAPAL